MSVLPRFPEIVKGVFRTLPPSVQQTIIKRYQSHIDGDFIDTLFDNQAEYEQYAEEFRSGETARVREEAFEQIAERSSQGDKNNIDLAASERIYALIRKQQPTTIVETGVSHGISTLSILQALAANNHGQLYSVDYPFRPSDTLEEFQEKTYEGFQGGAMLPAGEDPGWIIPDSLYKRWSLIIGKSQATLPELVVDIDEISLFVRDSEHSIPAMMFEFELAWEWLSDDGIVISDDIRWNDAFDTFASVRGARSGLLTPSVGYLEKPQ